MTVIQTEEPSAEWRATFALICQTYRGRLVRWLAAMFGPHDAEDIAQEALARLYARPDLLREEANPWPWLSVVARNAGRDLARHNAHTRVVDALDLADLAADRLVWDDVVARDDADRLARAMNEINPQDRALLRLRDLDGYSIAEIADRVGTTENAARQQLFRARRKLRATYVAHGGDRQAGGMAVLELKLKELVRRHASVFDVVSTVSTAAAMLGPAAVAAGVGALVAIGPAATGAAVRVTASPAAGIVTEPRHGIAPLSPAAGMRARPAGGTRETRVQPYDINTGDDVGPAHFFLRHHRGQWTRDDSGTASNRHMVGVWVDNPTGIGPPAVGFVVVSYDGGEYDHNNQTADCGMHLHKC